jgi:hypothetical protein
MISIQGLSALQKKRITAIETPAPVNVPLRLKRPAGRFDGMQG